MDNIIFRKIHNLELSVEKVGKKRNSCQDYLQEKKLQRIIKKILNDKETLKDLIGRDGFGKTEDSVIENINLIINDKVTSLNGKEIREYIEKLQKVPISDCLVQIRRKYS